MYINLVSFNNLQTVENLNNQTLIFGAHQLCFRNHCSIKRRTKGHLVMIARIST